MKTYFVHIENYQAKCYEEGDDKLFESGGIDASQRADKDYGDYFGTFGEDHERIAHIGHGVAAAIYRAEL
jgi:hypothetical protein